MYTNFWRECVDSERDFQDEVARDRHVDGADGPGGRGRGTVQDQVDNDQDQIDDDQAEREDAEWKLLYPPERQPPEIGRVQT